MINEGVMIDRGACLSPPERELDAPYEAAALMSKSGYGDLVRGVTTEGNGSTATVLKPLISTENRKHFHSSKNLLHV